MGPEGTSTESDREWVLYSGSAPVTQKLMIRGFLLGLIGVFILLSFQFKSYVEPLIVMVAILTCALARSVRSIWTGPNRGRRGHAPGPDSAAW